MNKWFQLTFKQYFSLFLTIIIFSASVFVIYDLSKNFKSSGLLLEKYFDKVRNHDIYFSKINLNDKIKIFSKSEIQHLQLELLSQIRGHKLLSLFLYKDIENIFKEKISNQENLIYNLKNKILSIESNLVIILIISCILCTILPIILLGRFFKSTKEALLLEDVTFYDVDKKSIKLGKDFYNLFNITDDINISHLVKNISQNLLNINQSLDENITTFTFPVQLSTSHLQKISIKLTKAGRVKNNIFFVVENVTNALKKIRNEIDIFEDSMTPYLLLNKRRIIAANKKFENLLGKSKERLIGAYVDHYSLEKTCFLTEDTNYSWELHLILNQKFKREVILSSTRPFYWGGEEKQVFLVSNIFSYNKKFSEIFLHQNINLRNHNLSSLFIFILNQNDEMLLKYLSEIKEKYLIDNNLELVNIVNDLEHGVFTSNWENVLLNFFVYAIKIEQLDELLLEAC